MAAARTDSPDRGALRNAEGPAGPGRRMARAVVGWTAATVLIAGLAWLLTAVITYWTSYAVLTVAGWQTLTYNAGSAQVSFRVHNSGSGEAEGCVAHLRLGHRPVIARSVPAIPAHGFGQFFVTYRLRDGYRPSLGYAWATCGSASTLRQAVPTVSLVSLVASHARITAGTALTTVRFQVRNLGSQPAVGCHAFLRLSTGQTVGGSALQSTVRAGAVADFALGYDPRARAGTPAAAWAECTAPAAGPGDISSGRVYLRSLLPAPARPPAPHRTP